LPSILTFRDSAGAGVKVVMVGGIGTRISEPTWALLKLL
jgi:hypothetical protein